MPLNADRLRQLRTRKGYSQKDLADVLQVVPQQVTRWESGRGDATGDTIARMATVLDCTTDWLLGLVDEPNQTLQPRQLSADEQQLLELYRQRKLPQMITRLVNELSRTNTQEELVVDAGDEAKVSGEQEPLDG